MTPPELGTLTWHLLSFSDAYSATTQISVHCLRSPVVTYSLAVLYGNTFFFCGVFSHALLLYSPCELPQQHFAHEPLRVRTSLTDYVAFGPRGVTCTVALKHFVGRFHFCFKTFCLALD